MNLRDPRLSDIQNDSDFLHRELFEIVEREYLALLSIQLLDSFGKQCAKLPAKRRLKRVFFRPHGDGGDVFRRSAIIRLAMNAPKIEPAQIAKQMLKFLKLQSQALGDFGLRRSSAHLRRKIARRFLNLPRLPPQIARTPIHLS